MPLLGQAHTRCAQVGDRAGVLQPSRVVDLAQGHQRLEQRAVVLGESGDVGRAAVLPTFRPLPFSASEASAAASRPGDRLLLRGGNLEDH